MSYYSRRIGPRIAHRICATKAFSLEREKIVPHAHGDVVEIGFGSGLNLPFYDQSKVRHLTAVNPDDGFSDLAARETGPVSFDVDLLVEGAEAMTIDTRSVDSVVATFTLCSIAKIDAALLEIRRILKPDGRLYFLEHGRSDNPRTARIQDHLAPIWRPIALGCQINRDPSALLREAGFVFDEHETYRMRGAPEVVGFLHRGIARIA